MSILLVIDMQPQFSASCSNWLLENVSKEIYEAMTRRDGIVFLEYTHCVGGGGVKLHERTHSSLMNLVLNNKYQNAIVVHKENDNGSREFIHAISGLLEPDTIRVVGVNKTACVEETVHGLSTLLPNAEIVVVGDACSDNETGNEEGPSNKNYGDIHRAGNNVRVLKITS